MKKKRYLLLIAILLFSLTGCQMGGKLLEKAQGKEEQTTEKEESEEKTSKKKSRKTDKSTENEDKDGQKEKTEKQGQITPEVYIRQNYGNDWNGNVTLMQVAYDTLEVEREAGSGLAAALAQYNDEAAAQTEEWKTVNRPYAEEAYNWNSSSFYSYEYTQEIQIHRADEQVLSFDTVISEYTGGAHGYTYYVGKTFDVLTGRELSLEDVVMDTSKLPEVIVRELQKKYPEEIFFDGYEEEIARQFNPDSTDAAYTPCWMLDSGGLVFYYAQYELASYSAGMLEVFLPFSEYPDLVKLLYRMAPDECALPMKQYQTRYFDLDGDGTLEEIYVCMYESYAGYGESQVHIYVNGEDSVYYPMYESWFDTAYLMKLKDGTCYLYVSVSEMDDMHEILVFYLGGRGAVFENSYIGTIEGNIFISPGHFKIISYLDILGTYSGYKYYYVDNDGMPRTDDKAYTIINYIYEGEPERCLTAKIPVPVWMVLDDGSMSGSPEELPAGTKFYFRKTDGRSYVEMELEDGRRCQIRVDISKWPRTVDGVDENECFDGIMYAG